MRNFFLVIFFNCILFQSFGQNYIFRENNSTIVSSSGKNLKNAWAGGINSIQVNKMDLNGDQFEDLVLFDVIGNRISTYIYKNGDYFHSPEYESFFPKILSWIVLADYNCDGKKDIFTRDGYVSNSFYFLKVYKNVSSGNKLNWQLAGSYLNGTGASNQVFDIIIASNEYPSIIDIDNDGDLDILNYNGAQQSGVELFLNTSKETYNNCDSLIFQKYSSCYGTFLVGSDCQNLISLNQVCTRAVGGIGDPVSRTQHQGSFTTIFDINKDGKFDIITSDLNCNTVVALTNSGTNLHPTITGVIHDFPTDYPINAAIFPLTVFQDIDNDGKKDMLASPYILSSSINNDLKHSLWYYKDTITNTSTSFKFKQNDFLQSDMIEVGENATPALSDYDSDGDLDLFVGNKGSIMNGQYKSSLALYKNIGTKDSAIFTLETNDYLSLSGNNFSYLTPGFTDINNDSLTDLYFLCYELNTANVEVKYILNSSSKNQPYNFDLSQLQTFSINNGASGVVLLNRNDKAFLFKIDSDNLVDLLISKYTGQLQYFKNTGTAQSPSFNLQNSTFGGFVYDADKQYFSVHLTQLNSKDTTELISIDRNGILKVFQFNNQSLTSPFSKVDTNIIYNNLDGYAGTKNFGAFCTVATGDLNNDGYKEIIIGTNGGGVILLNNGKKNTPIVPKPPDPPITTIGINTQSLINKIDFEMYPNPTSGKLNLIASSEGIVQITDITGKKMCDYNLKSNEINKISLMLSSGLYFVNFSNKYTTISKKLLIE
ncbi:MAG: FG-GAP-like repeat-containing protein [Bacteroidota bacterium]|nr:FG-GAP-like repeat-containing protein [Bacteroidota bacterium]